MSEAAKEGGVPGKTLLRACDRLLSLTDGPDEVFGRVEDFCATAGAEVTPLRARLQAGRGQLAALVGTLKTVRRWLAEPPRISISPDDLKRLTDQADHQGG
jgi:hypothetical protein